MKLIKKTKRYCPYCNKHTEQKVLQVKSKGRPKTKVTALKWGVRQFARISKGYGGSPRIKPSSVKTSKYVGLQYECTVCKKKHYKKRNIRAKRVERV